MKFRSLFPTVLGVWVVSHASVLLHAENNDQELKAAICSSLETLADDWYPVCVDTEYGGFYTKLDREWKPSGEQNKFIIHQTRHLWSLSKLAKRFPDNQRYLEWAKTGYAFVRDHFQNPNGGFYWSVNRAGVPVSIDQRSNNVLQTYAHAFTIYALAAYADVSGDVEALELAQQTFLWLENELYDDEHGGYFNSIALREKLGSEPNPLFLKGQNTSIHLMEAFAELYRVWQDPLLEKRLREMVWVVADTLQDERGFTQMFFDRDWTQQTFVNHPNAKLLGYHQIENVSFGHDVEIAYLLLDAVDALGATNESDVLPLAQKITEHALRYAWDFEFGGLFESGKYFGEDCVVVKPVKTWWVQAENLNALVLLATRVPEQLDHYMQLAHSQWNFINSYQIDAEYGGWFEEVNGTIPRSNRTDKSHRWKANYHTVRALWNVESMIDQMD